MMKKEALDIAKSILQKEIRDIGDAREIFNFYHNNDSEISNITRNTLFEVYKIKPQSLPDYPNNRQFALVLTHDVDFVRPSWKYYAYHIVARPLTILKVSLRRVNPYNTFSKIINLEKKFDAKSTFFFMANEKDPTGVRYQIESLENEIGMLKDEGFEIGLHGSYNAYKDPDLLRIEKNRFKKAVKIKVVGYRNHYLRFKIPETWEILERAGFKYDSTLGYNDLIGFRGGLPYPFMPSEIGLVDCTILEIPLVVMDVTLFVHMNLPLKEAWKEIDRIFKLAEKYHGVITVNWHSDKFDGIYWKNWERVYIKILKEAKRRRAWLTNCEELIEWWKNGT